MTVDLATTTRPTAALRPNPLNPRGQIAEDGLIELANSIRAQGILQPLLVTPDDLVVAGHHRQHRARQGGDVDFCVDHARDGAARKETTTCP